MGVVPVSLVLPIARWEAYSAQAGFTKLPVFPFFASEY